MKKKYTIEEFKEMFDKAIKISLDELLKDFEKALEGEKELDAMQKMAFTMQNGMAYSALRKNLFGGKSNE